MADSNEVAEHTETLTPEARGEAQAERVGFATTYELGDSLPVPDTTEELLSVNPEACVATWLTSKDNAKLARGAIEAAKAKVREHNAETKACVQRLAQLVNDRHRKRFVLCKGKLVCIEWKKDAPAHVFIAEDNLSITAP